jgi:hypothetical protein
MAVARNKSCLFCGAALQPKSGAHRAKTDEHVFPDWLQEHLGIKGNVVTPMRVRSDNRQIIDMRRHVMGAFVAGSVCYDCNHGWMSALENEVNDVLIRLIVDPIQLGSLTDVERRTLARWTVKTAAVLNRCSTYGNANDEIGRPVPDEHLRILASGTLPNDVLVVGAGSQSAKTVDFLQYAIWTNPANSIPLRDVDRNLSYKVALSFRDLVLMVAYYPSADYVYGINSHHYVPLWTGSRRVIPIDHLMDESPAKSSSPQLELLLRNISVVSHTWLALVENVAFTRLVQPLQGRQR